MSSSSSKKLVESKDQAVHIGAVDHPLFTNNFGGEKGVVHIINESSGFTTNSSLWSSFFKSASLQEEILLLARYAAPLETVEAHIRKAHEKKEAHLPETLVQATIQAIQDGDVNLIDDKKKIISEGMAEKLMELCSKLYPDQYSHCLEQVKAAIPIEDEKQKNERERLNGEAIKKVFDAIKKNDKDTNDAIKNFKTWAKTTSGINRIHLIYLARTELANRGGELEGSWYGKLGDRFCYEVIGDALQRENLSPRMQQILATGLYYIFTEGKKIERFTDFDGAAFIRPAGANIEIGVSGVYDEFGVKVVGLGTWRPRIVSKLITSNYDSLQYLLHPSRVRTYEQEVCDRQTCAG